MHTSKKLLVLIVALGLVMVPGAALGVPDRTGYDPVDGPPVEDQHGTLQDHLPASSANVNLVSKLRLTELDGGIADVGYFKGYAYLNAWGPNCPGGGGVHVVDVRDPKNPVKVGFLPAETNAFPGEGVHVMTVNTPFFQGDLLVHNNENCDVPVDLGISIWDVTDPLNPEKIGQFGDTTPAIADQTYHSYHSVQGFTQPGKAFAVATDNNEIQDVDIMDITDPFNPVMAKELGLEDWPGAQGSYANGDTVFLHDEQFKRIGGNDFLALSYWNTGL